MQPLISIIVPIYKVEKYLNECIQSIVNQTYKNLEIILVDDGSPDSCPFICDEWSKKDKRIHVIHKINGGLSSARNAGLEIANGEYIGFVDSDDYISSDMYEKLLAGFYHTTENIGIVSGQILKVDDNIISRYNSYWEKKTINIIPASNFAEEMILGKSNFTCWSKLYHKELLNKIRFYEGRNNEDSYFMFDLSKKIEQNKVNTIEIPEYVYYYRIRNDSICTSTKKPLEIDIIKNFNEFKSHFEKVNYILSQKIRHYIICLMYNFCHKLYFNKELYIKYFNVYYTELRKESAQNILSNSYLSFHNKISLIIMCRFPNSYRKIYKIIKSNK